MLPVPDHSAPSSAPGTIVNAASFAADQQSRRAPQSVASTTLKLLQLNALHQQGQSDSSKVMCCLAIDKWSVKLCHSRSLTDRHARLHREMANGCGGSSPQPTSSGVMDDVTKSPCEGAMHRLQMLRQVDHLWISCRLSDAT